MNTTTLTDPSRQEIGETLYYALFRVAAIADLEGPAKAVEWAQSVLDDDRLRAAFVAGIASSEPRSRGVRHGERPGGSPQCADGSGESTNSRARRRSPTASR